jgi:glycosyltransferase involved in cell wall biosynthesis
VQNEECNVTHAIRSTFVPGASRQPEVIVVDGGSSDGTLAIAKRCGSHRVLTVKDGRGAQLNAGADASSGKLLLFLHADCDLPKDYFPSLRAATAPSPKRDWQVWGNREVVRPRWGCFSSIDTGDKHLWCVHLGVWARTLFLSRPYGDQALFCERSLFMVCHFAGELRGSHLSSRVNFLQGNKSLWSRGWLSAHEKPNYLETLQIKWVWFGKICAVVTEAA